MYISKQQELCNTTLEATHTEVVDKQPGKKDMQ